MSRKTFEVATLKKQANHLLALPEGGVNGDVEHINADFRHGVRALLEWVLQATENYQGFSYQSSESLPEEERDYEDGCILRRNYDDTRRVYF